MASIKELRSACVDMGLATVVADSMNKEQLTTWAANNSGNMVPVGGGATNQAPSGKTTQEPNRIEKPITLNLTYDPTDVRRDKSGNPFYVMKIGPDQGFKTRTVCVWVE